LRSSILGRTSVVPALLLIVPFVFAIGPAQGAPGALGQSAGSSGEVTTNFAPKSDDGVSGLALQPDGKIVAAGTSEPPDGYPERFALARYSAKGALDQSFGDGGRVTTKFDGNDVSVADVALQQDGKVVVAGGIYLGSTCTSFALARYNPDGSLDHSFGSHGTVTTHFGANDWTACAFAVAIQPDGKIVAAGSAGAPAAPPGSGPVDFALARYNANGTPDPGFGSDGRVMTDFGGDDRAAAIALQPDGKLVVAGRSVVARYNADGSLDRSFGSDGNVALGFDAQAVNLQPDGKIVAAGFFPGYGYEPWVLARYKSDGSPDSSFGSGGEVATAFSDHNYLEAIQLQPDGKIVAVGTTLQDPNSWKTDFALARYNPDGSLDASFGGGGKVTTAISPRASGAAAVALQPNGRMVAAGASFTCTYFDFALVRYKPDGSLDPSFGGGKRCIAPKVKGKGLQAAKRAIKHRDCLLGPISRRFSRTVKKGDVISQSPRAGARCWPEPLVGTGWGPNPHPSGPATKVSLKVSKGRPGS
jgi:uncharacterized delta-60 repeat protein